MINKRKTRKKYRKFKKNLVNEVKSYKDWFIEKVDSNKLKLNNSHKKIKDILEKNKKKIFEIINFIVYVVGYGLIINYMLWGIFGINFSIWTFPAYGILTYLIRDEFVLWIRKIISRR